MRTIAQLSMSVLAGCSIAASTQAAEWQHTLTPYLWAASLSGETAVGPVTADVNVAFGDVLKNLKMAAMVNYRGERDRLVVLGDLMYMRLGADETGTQGPVQVHTSLGMEQWSIEGDAGYKISEHTAAFAGLRYIDLTIDTDIVRTGPGAGASQSAADSKAWVDPVIGMITEFPLGERWSLGLRGDIGGFGVGSEFAWQAMAHVRWQARKNLYIIGGYRYLSIDYKSGSGVKLFKYDMATSGLDLGVAFTF